MENSSQPPIPSNYIIGKVSEDEDSFFSSVAQCLQQLKSAKTNSQELWQKCQKHVQEYIEISRAFGNQHITIYGINVQDYLALLEKGVKGPPNSARSRPEPEGRIICNAFKVNIHVLNKPDHDNINWWHSIVNRLGENQTTDVDYESIDTIHVICEGNLRFKPILKRNITEHSGNSDSQTAEMTNYIVRKGARGAGGHVYEIKLSMLFYLRLKACGEIVKFYLATNMENAGDFGDAVFKYQIKEKDGNYTTKVIFLQAKHREVSEKSESGSITKDSLLSTTGPFSLKKYIGAYQRIKTNIETAIDPFFRENFNNCSFIIFTNYILDTNRECDDSHISNPSRWIEHSGDEIVVGKGGKSVRLNPSADINGDIIANLSCYPICELTREIYDYTLGTKRETGIRASNKLFHKYRVALANQVFAVNTLIPKMSKFSDKFHEARYRWKEFCEIAGKEQDDKQFRSELAKVTVNFPKEFVKHVHQSTDVSLPGLDTEEVKEFLSKLEFVLGQKNESELDEVIKAEIQETCEANDEEMEAIFGSVQSKIESWRSNDNNFLTTDTKFVEDARTSLSQFQDFCKERISFTEVLFEDTVLNALKDSILSQKVLNIEAENGTSLLSTVKVYQTLDREYEEKSYNFIQAQHLLNIQDHVLRVFESEKEAPYFLVVESNRELLESAKWVTNKGIRLFYNKLFEIIEKSENKYVILITEIGDSTHFDCNVTYLQKISDDIHLNHLTNESQQLLLNKEITLQGISVKINELIPECNDQFKENITSKLLMNVINNTNVVIGKAPQRLSESDAVFTSFYDPIPKKNLVKMIEKPEVDTMIVISGIKEPNVELLAKFLGNEDTIATHVNERISDGTIIIPHENSTFDLREFKQICANNCEKTVYWVAVNLEVLRLQQVFHPHFYIQRKFRRYDKVVLTQKILCQKNDKEVIVFRSAADKRKIEKLVNELEEKCITHFNMHCLEKRIMFKRDSEEASAAYDNLNAQDYSVHWLEISRENQIKWHKSNCARPKESIVHLVSETDLFFGEANPHVFIFSKLLDREDLESMIQQSCARRKSVYRNNCKIGRIIFSDVRDVTIEPVKQTTHWIKIEEGDNEQLILEETRGSISQLRAFFDEDKCKRELHTEDEISKLQDKVVIIAGEPGMGKTTSLTSVSRQMLNKNWVIRINFLDCEHAIDSIKESELLIEDVYDFVSKVESTGLRNDWAKLMIKHKLTPVYLNTWPILFLFDGFDEISKERQQKILPLLQFIKYRTAARLWVTARLDKKEILENGLSAFATEFQELSRKDRLEFLTSSWTVRLSPFLNRDSVKQRTKRYSSCLLGNVSDILGYRFSDSLGVSLQLRLLSEALRRDYVNYVNGGDDHPPNFSHVNVLYVYRHFIQEKYEIYIKDKNRLNVNESLKLPIFTSFDKNHETLAFNLLFPEHDIIRRKGLSVDEDTLKSVGIIQSIGVEGKPYFLHRTFAEYFAAKLLFRYVRKKESNPKKYKSTAEFLNTNIFEESNFVIRNFINLMSIEPNKDFPVHVATIQNNIEDIVLLTRDTKNRQNCDKFGRTSLHIAAREGRLDVVKVLLDSGCDAIAQDLLGKTALHYAAMKGHEEVVEHILNYAADINIWDNIFNTPLHVDTEVGDGLFRDPKHLNSKLVTLTNTEDIEGYAALHYATEIKHWEIASKLIAYGANVSFPTGEVGIAILNYNVTSYHGNSIVGLLMLKSLVPEDLRVSDILADFLRMGHTKVFHAVRERLSDQQICWILERFTNYPGKLKEMRDEDHLKVSKYLMKERNDEDMANRLATDAARLGNVETLKYVLSQCHKHDNVYYMDCAMRGHNLNIVKLLEGNFSCDNDGNTALHLAVCFGSLEIVKYLVENNADVNALNKHQDIPLDMLYSRESLIVKPYLRTKCNSDYDEPRGNGNVSTSAYDRNSDWFEVYDVNDPVHKVALSLSDPNTAPVRISQDDIVKFFRKSPKNYGDRNGVQELHLAAYIGDIDELKSFHKFEYFFALTDEDSHAALHYAVKNDQIEVVKFLLFRDTFKPKYERGIALLDIATGKSKKFLQEIQDIFDIFQHEGSNVESLKSMQRENNDCFIGAINCRDDYGNTLLGYAASSNDIDSVLFILRNGGSFERCPFEQSGAEVWRLFTCLNKSIEEDYGSAQRYIECFDKYSGIADVRDDFNRNILHKIANISVNYYLLNYLVERGANINAVDQFNKSVMTSAIDSENLDLVKFLLCKGVNVKDLSVDAKRRLFVCAKKKRRPDIIDLFKSLRQKSKKRYFKDLIRKSHQ